MKRWLVAALRAARKLAARWRYRYRDRLEVRFHDLRLRFDTSASEAKRWFFPRYGSGEAVHEPPVAELLRDRLGPDDVFFDVGANLGFFTVLAAALCRGPGGEVHAFEMDPALVPLARASLELNGTADRVRLVCAACDAVSGELRSFAPAQPDNPSTNRILPGLDGAGPGGTGETSSVSLSLDDYCSATGVAPDLIKVDVEGAEGRVLHGARDTIARHRPELLVEVHRSLGGATEGGVADLVRTVSGWADYRVRALADHRRPVEGPVRDRLVSPAPELEGEGPVVLLFDPGP